MKSAVLSFCVKVLWALLAGCLVGAFTGWLVARALHIPQLDQLPTYRPAAVSEVFAADGSLVQTFALERRVELPPEQMPEHLKLAIVAAEDAKFYEHGGVDPKAILRAAIGSIRTGELGGAGGGSTLTQQLALALFLERERTLTRKIKEAFLALDMEKRLTKDQILALYVNQVFFGHDAYGVEAAAKLYFNISASELSLAQAAMLAGMIPSANNKFNPIRRPERTRERRDHVLGRMLELGFIDRGQYEEAVAEPLGAELHRDRVETGAYFLEHVRKTIEHGYGTETLHKGGLSIDLTMDPGLQRAAEKAVREGLVALDTSRLGFRQPPNVVAQDLVEEPEAYEDPSWKDLEPTPGGMVKAVVLKVSRSSATVAIAGRRAELSLESASWTKTSSLKRILRPGDLVLVRYPDEIPEDAGEVFAVELLQEPEIEGALLAMDNRSGAVLAMVGGFDFERSEFNRAVQSKLQCGSAFKPFVFLTAFENGFTPADTVFDAPFLLPDAEGEMTYCPKNYYDKYYGVTPLRKALEMSYNAASVKLQNMVGGQAVVEVARAMGISTELHPYASLALGTLGVRLIDLVRAYAGFANLGEVPEPYFVAEVRDRDGKQLERHYPVLERRASAAATYLLLHVLEGVVQQGTGQAAKSLGIHTAGKTGTTDDHSDAWYVGSTPRITVGVWVGRDQKAPIGKKMSGAVAALPIWIRFMESYLQTLDEDALEERFPVPAGVVFSAVDRNTGHVVVPACANTSRVVLEAFLDGTEPTVTCEGDDPTLYELPWPFQVPYYEPREGEPMPTPEAVLCADERLKPEEDEEGEDGEEGAADGAEATG